MFVFVAICVQVLAAYLSSVLSAAGLADRCRLAPVLRYWVSQGFLTVFVIIVSLLVCLLREIRRIALPG